MALPCLGTMQLPEQEAWLLKPNKHIAAPWGGGKESCGQEGLLASHGLEFHCTATFRWWLGARKPEWRSSSREMQEHRGDNGMHRDAGL